MKFLTVSNSAAVLFPVAVFCGTLATALVIRRILTRKLRDWAARTTTTIDDMAASAIQTPSLLWAIILSLYIALQVSSLPARVIELAARTLMILWVVSATLALSSLAAVSVKHFGARVGGAMAVTSLAQNLGRLLVASMGCLLLLSELGIAITPILTALGVGGIAVALALQDTLSNLFAGVYVSMAGQVRVGDYIRLDSGQEGYVSDITWRATGIRTLQNNLMVVPNGRLAQAIVTNHSLPEPRMSLLIPIGVDYESDPDQVERILVEVAVEGAKDIPGLLAEPAPFVRFIPGFGAYSLDLTLICQVAEFVDQYIVQHELRKRILRRFRSEGIQIPFPVQTVNLQNTRS